MEYVLSNSVFKFHLTKRGKAIVVLSLLSPVFAELLSGSTPPLEFINPISFFFLWGFYGAGVLLAREFWVRWGRGYVRLMLLGMAYGIYEEGLAIKSWFDPRWMDLGVFGSYGRIWGINTVWAVWLTIFHSVMSISAPIIVFSYVFPEYEKRSLLNETEMKKVFLIFMISTFLCYFGLNPYAPPIAQYLLVGIVMVIIIWLSMQRNIKAVFKPMFSVSHPVLYGFVSSFSLFLIFTALPHYSVNPVIPCVLGVVLILHFYSQLEWQNPRGRYLQIFGFLSFWFLPWAFILELHGVLGMSVAGIVAFFVLYRKTGMSPKFMDGFPKIGS